MNIHREGDFYDFYGNLIGRGWLIYDWSQNQPEQLGSSIFQNSRFDLVQWCDHRWRFSRTVLLYDYCWKLTVTTLTPMTFSRPRFNGVQIDFMADS